MNEHPADTHPGTDGLWRWLVGGLVGGGIILGLLIAAYAIGYHRGQHHTTASTPATSTTTPSTPTTTTGTALGPVTVTPALVARGKALYSADGCSACHSLTGTAGVGPSFKSLAGSKVTLDQRPDRHRRRRLPRAIDRQPRRPDRQGLPRRRHAGRDRKLQPRRQPNDVRALVAFIKAQT